MTEKALKPPEFKPLMRAWKTADEDSLMRCYLAMDGRVTIRDLVEHFAENHPAVDPMALRLNFATVTWDEPPTPEDLADRAERNARHDERHARWERQMYEKLKAKFEGESDDERA